MRISRAGWITSITVLFIPLMGYAKTVTEERIVGIFPVKPRL
ncbi:MAG: hypothetical protein ACLFV6_14585 [Spirulinaceae cyanobacterium]